MAARASRTSSSGVVSQPTSSTSRAAGVRATSTVGTTLTPRTNNDQFLFNIFRIGEWPNYFPNVQFPRDAKSLDQYFRQTTRIPARTRSRSRRQGGVGAVRQDGGRRIAHHALRQRQSRLGHGHQEQECAGDRLLRAGAVHLSRRPASRRPAGGTCPQLSVSEAEFKRLTKIPIQLVYGDNIPNGPSNNAGLQLWVNSLANAKAFVQKVNQYGGNAELLILPEIGVRGNTQLPRSQTSTTSKSQTCCHATSIARIWIARTPATTGERRGPAAQRPRAARYSGARCRWRSHRKRI